MCTSITVTRLCVPLSRRTNITSSNTVADKAVTKETLSLFRKLKGISKIIAFLKDGMAKYDVSSG